MNLDLWKQRKKELHLKYEDIAKQSGIPITTVKYIFCGYVDSPRIDTVQAIEKVLGIAWELTDEEKAAGVGRRKIYLSDEEYDWLEIRSEILRVKGEDYLNTLTNMLEAITKDENNQVKK